jgi:hemerythrin superfamily protein
MAQTRGSRKEMDAIEMLKKDHKEVDGLFKQIEALQEEDDESAQQVVETVCVELTVHSMLEKEIFYPAVREQAGEEEEDLLNEAEVEHKTVEQLIQAIQGSSFDDPMRKANVTVLMEYVKHHVKEEEEEMFPKVKQMKGLDLADIGAEMMKRKQRIMADMGVELEETEEEA